MNGNSEKHNMIKKFKFQISNELYFSKIVITQRLIINIYHQAK